MFIKHYLCTIKLHINIQTMKQIAENQQKKSLLGQLGELEIGGHITVPVSRTSYLRSICSSFGLEWNKKFSVSLNRPEGTITATRIQ